MTKTQIPECRKKFIKGKGPIMCWPIACSKCGEMEYIQRPSYLRLGKDIATTSEQCLTKALDGMGWSYKKHLKHIKCCRCTKEEKTMPVKTTVPMKAEPPREITREARRRIADLLEEVYITNEGMYQDAESDSTVAETLKYPAAWVAQVRELLFGDGSGNQAGTAKNRELDMLESKVNDIEFSFNKQIEMIRADIGKLRD